MKRFIKAAFVLLVVLPPLLFPGCIKEENKVLGKLLKILPGNSSSIITMNFKNGANLDIFSGEDDGANTKTVLSSYIELLENGGIDIKNDIDVVALGLFDDNVVVTASLSRNTSTILAGLRAGETEYTEEAYRGVVILKETGRDFAVAFIAEDIMAAGELAAVKAVVDVSQGAATSVVTSGKLMFYVGELTPDDSLSFIFDFPTGAKNVLDLGIAKLDITQSNVVIGHINYSDTTTSGRVELVCSNASILINEFNKLVQSTSMFNNLGLSTNAGRIVLNFSESITRSDPTPSELSTLRFIKKYLYGMYTFSSAAQILAGTADPMVTFTVENTPPSVYYNFVVPDANAAAFAAAIPLPSGFTLSKIRIIDGETPKYYLTANVYRVVASMTEEMRVEWSTYVDAGEGIPRYMVIEPRSAVFSSDPVNIFTPAGVVQHAIEDGQIRTYIESEGSTFFQASFDYPVAGLPGPIVTDREWAIANDYIYWTNGVCDRTFYVGGMHNGDVVSIDPADVIITDTTARSAFINPVPANVLVYQDKIELVVSPWYNLNETDLDPAAKALRAFIKQFMYGSLTFSMGSDIMAGKAEPIINFTVLETPPSIFYIFRIPDANVPALEAAIGLPTGFSLAKIKILESDAEEHYYMNQNVYEVAGLSGMLAGIRAEWSVYVYDAEGVPRFMVIEASCDSVSMDSVDLFTMPRIVEHTLVGNQITSLAEAFDGTFFEASFPVPGSGINVVGTREWIAANDFIYWRNGVCDHTFYGGDLLDADMISIDLNTVILTDETPWADFIDPIDPLGHVLLYRNKLEFAIMPWWNLEEL